MISDYFEIEIGVGCYSFNRPVEERFREFVQYADRLGYSLFLQHCCFNCFGHGDLWSLSPVDMDRLMSEAEPVIFEAAIQFRLMK